MVRTKTLVALVALSSSTVYGIDLDVNDSASIKSAASTIAKNVVSFYHGSESGHEVGVLDTPYYWWEAGAVFDTLIQYWYKTSDSQYNGLVTQALVAQQGPNNDFMPTNQTKSEGNDDQAVWALAAISAAESNLPAPSGTNWTSLASNTFNEQATRWNTSSCGGGLRWQIFPFNQGYNYKNSASNGLFFQLASRLARSTGNSTYSDWATRAFDWSTTVGFVDKHWNVYDGSDTEANCTDINKVQFSWYAGTYISGAAHMYNITTGDAQAKWKSALDGLLNQTLSTFFTDGIATEISCEPRQTCNPDMKTFKGALGQLLADTIQVAPYTSQIITPQLSSSAKAATKACTIGNSNLCPLTWSGSSNTENSSAVGVGEQLSALSYVQGLLTNQAVPSTGNTTTGPGASPTTSPAAGPTASSNAGSAVGIERTGLCLFAAVMASAGWLVL